MLVVPFSFDFFIGYVERQAKAKTTAIQKPLYDWDWRTASRVIDTMPLKRQPPQHLPKAFHFCPYVNFCRSRDLNLHTYQNEADNEGESCLEES